MTDKVDVAIVGAGTAGLAALQEVRKQTDDFVLINKRPYGTTCARVGCMPSKTLIAAANAYHARVLLDTFGIKGGGGLKADIPAVMARVRNLRDHFVESVLKSTEDLGERDIAGQARLDGPNRLVVDGRRIEARQIILAPGSSPIVPPPWQAFSDRILTTDTLFEEPDLPARIGVIGLGAVGVELAQALARLGIEVHGFDGAEHLAGISDDKVAGTLHDLLTREFPIHLGVEADLAEADDGVKITWGDGNESIVVDKVLVAVGRRPNLQDLGLDSLGVPLDDKGMPEVDPNTMRIADTPVLFAGDANGFRAILHEGADEGHIAGINATNDGPVRLDRRTPMTVTFCSPQVAAVGQQAGDLEECLIGEVDYSAQGRARVMQENAGLLRIYAASEGGRLLGAEMAAPDAEHLAHLLALAIKQDLTVHDLLRMPFYHPTLEEGLRTALRDIAGKLPPCSISDLAGCGSLKAEALE